MISKDTTILPHGGVAPKIDASAFVAAGVRVIGDVEIGAESSLWYNVVVRADVDRVRIGARTNIQDGSIIHVTTGLFPTLIGEDVLVGHLAMLHGCTIEDRGFVGLGAIVMDGCVIEEGAMLAAGAMLTPNKRISRGQMWGGRPAVYMRDLRPQEVVNHQAGVMGYVELARRYRAELAGL
jgi:carbonic anhydrase/acetyltransferase-like protein (isoleucine patch superfamily)